MLETEFVTYQVCRNIRIWTLLEVFCVGFPSAVKSRSLTTWSPEAQRNRWQKYQESSKQSDDEKVPPSLLLLVDLEASCSNWILFWWGLLSLLERIDLQSSTMGRSRLLLIESIEIRYRWLSALPLVTNKQICQWRSRQYRRCRWGTVYGVLSGIISGSRVGKRVGDTTEKLIDNIFDQDRKHHLGRAVLEWGQLAAGMALVNKWGGN